MLVVAALAAGILLFIGSTLGAKATQARVNLTVHNLDTVLADVRADIQSGNVVVARRKLAVLHSNRFGLTLPVRMETLTQKLTSIEEHE